MLDFSGISNGSYPSGSFISDGTYLYGMTYIGGINNFGTIFKIKHDGTGYAKLLDFAGVTNGKFPVASLISDGTFLYGMTLGGGIQGGGTIFKIKLDGTGFVKLMDFGGSSNGTSPRGSLISDGTFLYGMTSYGGTNNLGTIFKIKPDGTGYMKLLDFAGAINGSNPLGSLISDNTFLYGMTYYGGVHDSGTVFKIKPDGTSFIKLRDFTGTPDGSNPCGSLISDGIFLYGMTQNGGTNNKGMMFKIKPDGTGFVKLLDFVGSLNGSNPEGSLITDGTFLVGVTLKGGTNNLGTLFKYCINPVSFSQSPILCAGNSIIINNHTYNSNGTYTDSLTSNYGCDSIITTNLTVLTANTFTQSITICTGHSVTIGTNTHSTAGTFTDVLTSMVSGCDSTVTTHLSIDSVDIAVSVLSFTLTAGASPATYQWIDCNNGNAPIAGQTNQSYTATANGSYAVIVTQGACSDTSSCYPITNIGIAENNLENTIAIFPNPTKGKFQIESSKFKVADFEIFNPLGEIIYKSKIALLPHYSITIDLTGKSKGIYFLKLQTSQGETTKKIILE